jgi:tetratricopeptide (TPR) repeat protein
MARRQSRDSGHSAFTDHRIAARPYLPAAAKEQPQQGRQLQAWREPGAEWKDRNLGIAYAREAETSGSSQDLQRSLRLLGAVERRFPTDPDVLGGLGMALLLSGSERRGIEKLERAIAAEPANSLRYPPVAAAWWQLGDEAKAMETLRSAIRTDPYYLPAYRMLAHILAGQGQSAEARKVWETYLRHVPQNLTARLALQTP